ncbi:MAG: GatB/YqeY domain-containing protein [Akkermansiaceae bacterium]|nr:GatB/YqeY domain-containing protein [Akkermansiaceae bacterium]
MNRHSRPGASTNPPTPNVSIHSYTYTGGLTWGVGERNPFAFASGAVRTRRVGSISEQLGEDLKSAMRAKDTVTLNTLRALKSAVKNAAIAKGGAGAELDEGEVVGIIRKQIKQREDSIEQYEKANRAELADQERAEIAVLENYLPAGLSADELAELVDGAVAEAGATTRADMGKVMKLLQERTAGRVDGKTLSQEVMKRLS